MQRRTRLLGLAALAVSTGALSTGFLVTSSALAADTPDPTGAVVQLIAAAPADPDELISCSYEGASFEALPALPAVAVPEGDVVDATGDDPLPFTVVEAGEVMKTGGVVETGEVMPGEVMAGEVGVDGVVGVDGAEPVALPLELVLDAEPVREGTAEECAAVTAPGAAVGATAAAVPVPAPAG